MIFRKLVLGCALVCLPISANADSELTQTLKRIDDSGEINLGYRKNQTPMSFDQGANKPAGYSVELCKRIAAAVKKKLGRSDIRINYVPVTAESRFDAIQSGKRVAVVSNTTTIKSLNSVVDGLAVNAEVVPVGSTNEGMVMLEQGQIDAFAADQVVLIGQVISRGGRKLYALSSELFSFEPFALAVARGDADFQLVADRVLSRLNRSGEIVEIYKKWFGSFGEKPPTGLKALYQLNSTPP